MEILNVIKEFGFSGVVVGLLFMALGSLAKGFVKHLDKVSARHQKQVTEILDSHKIERKDWIEQETKRADIFKSSLDRAVDKLVKH